MVSMKWCFIKNFDDKALLLISKYEMREISCLK
jgi:hypothetical protein